MAPGETSDPDPSPSISRLASSLSHEIRNPLSSVKMAIQTVQRSSDISERDRRRLTIAHREVRTIERMLALLSEYGRETPPRKEPIAIQAVVQDAAAMVEPELAERQIKLNLVRDSADIPAVPLDKGRLQAAFAPFLLNVAMGHSAGAAIDIRIGADKGRVFLQIRDPAPTLRPADRATLFEPFGSRLARGAGLTLAVLQHVVKMQGGCVQAEAEEPMGILFTIQFAL